MVYTFQDLAFDVLKQVDKPLIYQDIWEKAKELGLASKIKTTGKTPWATLGAILYVDVRDNPESKFIKVGKRPARFFLKEKESDISEDLIKKMRLLRPNQKKRKANGSREIYIHY